MMKLVTINGNVRPMQGANLSDAEVASMVRMLMRNQLNHESICTLARDRIVYLSSEVERLTAELAKTDFATARADALEKIGDQ